MSGVPVNLGPCGVTDSNARRLDLGPHRAADKTRSEECNRGANWQDITD